jgi:hypothetical protein
LGIGRQALFFVTLACVLPGVAWGSVVATDDIGYPDGAINPNGGTGSWLGGWTGSGVQIESGEIVTVATSTPPLYAARAFAQPNTGDLFVRFDLTLPPSVALGDYLGASLSTGVNNPILTWGKPEGSPELFVGNSLLVSSGIAAVADSTVQLVAAYQRTPGPVADRMLLWIDPDPTDFYDAATGEHSADAETFEFIAFDATQLTLFAEIVGVRFDDVVIGDDAESVGLSSVPEPGLAMLVSAGVLGLAAGRRARRAPNAASPPRVASPASAGDGGRASPRSRA